MQQASLFSPLVPSGYIGGPNTPQPQSAGGVGLSGGVPSNAAPSNQSMFPPTTPAPMTPATPASEGSGITPQLQYV